MMNPVPRIFAPFGGRWPRGEFSVLASLFVVTAALLAFAAIADETTEGDTRQFDTAVLLAFRNPADLADPIGPPWLETAFRDITGLGGSAVLTLITTTVIGYLLLDGKRPAALLMIAAIGGGAGVNNLLKHGFGRPRPELVPHLVDVSGLSFPSGHAMLSAIVYLTLGALLARVESRPRIKAYLLAVAIGTTLLVGVSRVYLGVHWPTDVLAGWCAGAAWAMLCWLVALWLQMPPGRVEPEGAGAADDGDKS